MNTYSPQQVKAILDRAAQKINHLSESDLLDAARESSIPEWCVQEAIFELETNSATASAASFDSAINPHPSIISLPLLPGRSQWKQLVEILSVSTMMVLLVFGLKIASTELVFEDYQQTAQPALSAATTARSTRIAQADLEVAIDWFESLDPSFTPTETHIPAAFEQLERIRVSLDTRTAATQLTVAEQSTIQLAFEVIDAEFHRNSGASLLPRFLILLLAMLGLSVGSCYLVLLFLQQRSLKAEAHKSD